MDCQNWTSTYLCTQCVRDLQSWLDKVAELLPELDVTIARLDVVRRSSEGGHSKTTGSAAPLNLDALQIKANLQSLGTDANYYAGDQFAAGIAWTIQDWVTKAEVIISGPEEIIVNHALNLERVRNIAPAMPTRQLVPWLREKAGITVTAMDVRNWARRGKLQPAEREPQPTYHPHEVLNAWHQTRNEANT
jgi:hypothetical protein